MDSLSEFSAQDLTRFNKGIIWPVFSAECLKRERSSTEHSQIVLYSVISLYCWTKTLFSCL